MSASTTDPLTLRFSRSAADYGAFSVQANREVARRPYYPAIYVASILVAGAVTLGLMLQARSSREMGLSGSDILLLVFAFFGVWSLINWIAGPLLLAPLHPRLDVFRAPLTIRVGDDALATENGAISQAIRWSAISDVVATPQHVFIRVDGTSTVVIPASAFRDAAHTADFLQAVRARIAAARPAQPQSPP